MRSFGYGFFSLLDFVSLFRLWEEAGERVRSFPLAKFFFFSSLEKFFRGGGNFNLGLRSVYEEKFVRNFEKLIKRLFQIVIIT